MFYKYYIDLLKHEPYFILTVKVQIYFSTSRTIKLTSKISHFDQIIIKS